MPKVQMATYMRVFIGSMGVITLVFAMAQAFVAPEDDSPYLAVTPRQLALEEGSSGQFECSGLLNYSKSVLWVHEDGRPVHVKGGSNLETFVNSKGATETSRIISDDQAVLVINNATLNDSQDFRCTTVDRDHGITVSLKVFLMPSYYTESMIIISINVCLLVIFLVCMTAAKVHEFKERKKTKRILRGSGTFP